MLRVLALILVVLPGGAAGAVDEDLVQHVASQLRCVVCQNLSVADSPSEMASQMRSLVRERLAAGDTPDEVLQYFVGKYGEWILLSPTRRGFNLVLWAAPLAAVVIGLAAVALFLRRATRHGDRSSPTRDAGVERAQGVDAEGRERIRRELEAEP